MPELLQFPYLGACPKDFTLQVVKVALTCHPCDERIPGAPQCPPDEVRPLLGLAWSFLYLPGAEANAQLWILTRITAAAQRVMAAPCHGLRVPLSLGAWKARATRQTQQHSLRSAHKGSPIHRAQIPPSPVAPRTQQQASETRLLAPVCKSSPACCSSQTSPDFPH